MKKLLHSLLLLSLVGSAMVNATIKEQDLLGIAGKISMPELEKLIKEQKLDMNEVQRTAEDLMYDVSGNAAQLLITRIIEELQRKQRYLLAGTSKDHEDFDVSNKQSKAIDGGIEAMRRDLNKLENGITDPEELETPAARTALEQATPLAFASKLTGMLGLGTAAFAGAGALGLMHLKSDYNALADSEITGRFDKVKAVGRANWERANNARLKTGAGVIGTAGAAAGLYGLTQTRSGRKIGAKIYRGMRSGIRWMRANPGKMALALTPLAVGAAVGGGLYLTRADEYKKMGVVSALKTAFKSGDELKKFVEDNFKIDVKMKVLELQTLIDSYNRVVKTGDKQISGITGVNGKADVITTATVADDNNIPHWIAQVNKLIIEDTDDASTSATSAKGENEKGTNKVKKMKVATKQPLLADVENDSGKLALALKLRADILCCGQAILELVKVKDEVLKKVEKDLKEEKSKKDGAKKDDASTGSESGPQGNDKDAGAENDADSGTEQS